LESNPRITH